MKKIIFKIIIGVVIIMTFGWIGSLFFGRYLTPILVNNQFFSEMSIFDNYKKNTTIINKTEKVIIEEDESMVEISSNAIYSVVEVMSFSKRNIEKPNKSPIVQNDSDVYIDGKRGAGTILTNDGVVTTSRYNIIEKESDYKIVTFNGNVLEAKLLGIDDFTDLAFLKVEGVNLTTIPFANSDEVNFGKKVILIGNHSGAQRIFLTEAILSAIDENFSLSGSNIAYSEKMQGTFEVDFQGKSDYIGGPMINYDGELLAISAIMNKGEEDFFYQVPINLVRDSMQKVVENRLDKSAKLGVYYLPIDPYYKNLKNLPVDKGAFVYSSSGKQGLAVVVNSVADRAGVKIGDIIVSIDGNEINSSHPLSNFISQYEQGTSAVLSIIRGDENLEINIDF